MKRNTTQQRSIPWTSNIFSYNETERLRQAGTHSDLAVKTFLGYSTDLNAIAALVSVESREVPVDVLWDFILQGDRDEIRARYCAVRSAELLAGSRIPPLDYPSEANDYTARGFGRVLAPMEIGLVRYAADKRLNALGTVNVAVFDAGGAGADLPHMAPDAVIDRTGEVGEFSFKETARTYARSAEIPVWALDKVDDAVTDAHGRGRPTISVGYTGQATRPERVVSAGLVMIGDVLQRCGLAADKAVRPSSITSTAGRTAWEQGGLEYAAHVLGLRSLDKVRKMIEIDPDAEPVKVPPQRPATTPAPRIPMSEPAPPRHTETHGDNQRSHSRHTRKTENQPDAHRRSAHVSVPRS